jgi:hypothetical protein
MLEAYFAVNPTTKTLLFEVTYDPQQVDHQVFSNYGPKSNEALLLSYGFVLPQNPHNSYWIQIALHESDPHRDEKLKLLKRSRLGMRYHLTMNEVPSTLFDAMRVCLMNSKELYFFSKFPHISSSNTSARWQNKWISPRNERLVYATLTKLIEERLNRLSPYDTEKDRQLLSDTNLSLRNKMAIQYRLEQKEILLASAERVKILQNNFFLQVSDLSLQFYAPINESLNRTKAEKWMANFCSHSQDVMFVIPEKYLITPFVASRSVIGKLLKKHKIEVDSELLLTLFLISERSHKDSPWRDFFDSLPESFSTPLYWTEDDISSLGNTNLAVKIRELQDEITQLFEEFVANLQEEFSEVVDETWTFDSFKWAHTVVEMFGEDIPMQRESDSNEERDNLVIVPIVPLPKYHPYLEPDFEFDVERRILRVTSADRRLNGCTQYRRSFHEKENSEMIMSYGIVVSDDNPFETFPLEIALVKDELFEKRRTLLQRLHLETNHMLRKGPLSLKLLQTLRICLADAEELTALSQNDSPLPISAKNERFVYEVLRDTLTRVLNTLDIPPVNEDELLLQRNDLKPITRLAVTYRMQQQKVVQSVLHEVSHWLRCFESTNSNAVSSQ